jgi:predicted transcriptional regulator
MTNVKQTAKATRTRITRDTLIGFRVTSELKGRLERLAEADNRPLSNFLENVLTAYADAAETNKKVPQTQSSGTKELAKARK